MPRPRKSRAQHELQGSYRPSRHGTARSSADPLSITAPAHFDDLQKAAWHDLATAGHAYLANSDAITLELCARLLAESRGPDVMPPARIAQLTRLLGRLGLDPTARGALDPVRPAEDDENPFFSF